MRLFLHRGGICSVDAEVGLERGGVERLEALSIELVHLRGGLGRSNGTLVIEAFLGGLDPKHLRCWGENGDEYPVKIARELTSGLYVIEIGRGASKKSRLLRLFPSHPGLVHPHELGVTIDLVAD